MKFELTVSNTFPSSYISILRANYVGEKQTASQGYKKGNQGQSSNSSALEANNVQICA